MSKKEGLGLSGQCGGKLRLDTRGQRDNKGDTKYILNTQNTKHRSVRRKNQYNLPRSTEGIRTTYWRLMLMLTCLCHPLRGLCGHRQKYCSISHSIRHCLLPYRAVLHTFYSQVHLPRSTWYHTRHGLGIRIHVRRARSSRSLGSTHSVPQISFHGKVFPHLSGSSPQMARCPGEIILIPMQPNEGDQGMSGMGGIPDFV